MAVGLVNLWMMSLLSNDCDHGRFENLGGRAVIEVYLMKHLQESDWNFWELAPLRATQINFLFVAKVGFPVLSLFKTMSS